MLDAYVIEEIKRREAERQRDERSRPYLEVPVLPPDEEDDGGDRESEGGGPGSRVVQIEL